MKGKLAFVLGAAVGYVLGTRAGRERYEQIKRSAQRVWRTEPVQRGVTKVKDTIDDRADDLRDFAVRVGNDIFSNLAKGSGGGQSDRAPRAAAGGASDAAESDSTAAESSTPASAKAASTASKSSGAKSTASRSTASRSTGAKSTGSGSTAGRKTNSRSTSAARKPKAES